MEVSFSPEVVTRLNELSASSGRPAQEFIEDAMSTYLEDLAEVRDVLASRYEETLSGAIVPLDGEEFFASLLERERELTKRLQSK